MNPPTDTGATEFLANLSVGTVVMVALTLTVVRLLLLRLSGPVQPGKNQSEGSLGRGIAEICESLIIAGVLVFLIIRPFFLQAFFIPSESMENTLLGHDAGENNPDTVHDHIFVNKLVYRYSDPHRGDIIVFRAPRSADAEDALNNLPQKENVLIKRVIGIPGDTISVKDGAVYRNGQRLNEYKNPKWPYSIKDPMSEDLEAQFKFAGPDSPNPALHLSAGQYWVMGDNRNNSNDSRYWGTLDRSRIMGKAEVIFWPLSRLRMLH